MQGAILISVLVQLMFEKHRHFPVDNHLLVLFLYVLRRNKFVIDPCPSRHEPTYLTRSAVVWSCTVHLVKSPMQIKSLQVYK